MNYSRARQAMIDGQLTPNKVADKQILSRFQEVAREYFVDVSHRENAYSDTLIAISPERNLMPPLVCARMIQGLEPKPQDKVLVLAAGSGYSVAIFTSMVKEIHAVEDNMILFEMAKRSLMDSKCKSAVFHEGKPELGLSKYAPYDKILIDAPVQYIPNQIWDQLKDGGKLAAVKEESSGLFSVTIYTKNGRKVEAENLFETGGKVLENFKQPRTFNF